MGRKAVRIEYSEPGLSDLRVAFYNYVKFKNKIKLKKKKSLSGCVLSAQPSAECICIKFLKKKQPYELPYDPAMPLLGRYPEKSII